MSGPQPPRTERFVEPGLNRIQKGLEIATQAARHNPLTQGVFLKQVKVTAANPTLVAHGLGRAYTGVIVGPGYGTAGLVAYVSGSFDPTKYVQLQAVASDCELDLYVF